MKKIYCSVLTSLIFFSIHAEAQFGKEWLTCKTDDDCIKINGLCGRKDSINKKFTADFDKFVEKMRAVSSCMELSEKEKAHNEHSVAKCAAGTCKLEDIPKK